MKDQFELELQFVVALLHNHISESERERERVENFKMFNSKKFLAALGLLVAILSMLTINLAQAKSKSDDHMCHNISMEDIDTPDEFNKMCSACCTENHFGSARMSTFRMVCKCADFESDAI